MRLPKVPKCVSPLQPVLPTSPPRLLQPVQQAPVAHKPSVVLRLEDTRRYCTQQLPQAPRLVC